MHVAILALAALLQPHSTEERVRALIGKLGSDEIQLRMEAVRDLSRIGPDALPLLRKALADGAGEQKILLDRLVSIVGAFGRPPYVTAEATDRPLKEFAGHVERQTGIPVRLVGAAADARGSWAARDTLVWTLIEDVCRNHGGLMYRFKDDAVEIHVSRFRALPSADTDGLRFFIDRFVWNDSYGGGNHFWQYGGVLAPRGTRVVRISPKMEECVDDLGHDPLKRPLHRMEPVFDGGPAYPASSRFAYPFYFNRPNDPPPALEAKRIVRCRGVIEVWLAGEEKVLASIPHPLAAPSVPAGPGTPSLGIQAWRADENHLWIHVKGTWDETSVEGMPHGLGPRFTLRLKDGGWRSVQYSSQEESWPDKGKVAHLDRAYRAPPVDPTHVTSLDFVAPTRIVKVEIPFDFRDLPLR